MNIDLDEGRILTALLASVLGALAWIYKLGGRVRGYEMDIEAMKDDVVEIKGSINEGVAARHSMERRLERIDTNQSHMSKTLDRIADRLEKS